MSKLAWHFVGDTLRDGRPVPEDGATLVHDGPLELCASGLHASVRPLDALRYAPGATVCRVRCDGDVIEGDDKLVCTRRTILWRIDANAPLRHFARLCALDVIHLWDAPTVVVQYLRTGNEELRTAARDAARDAAWAAARDAAWDAAWAAARDASRDASWAAARDAARAAARDASWAAQNRRLSRMLHAAHKENIR